MLGGMLNCRGDFYPSRILINSQKINEEIFNALVEKIKILTPTAGPCFSS